MATDPSTYPLHNQDGPDLAVVPKGLMAFLSQRFAAIEAKMDSRFAEIDESLKHLNQRVDEAHKSIRKFRRAANSDSQMTDKNLNSSSPTLSSRHSDSVHSKSRNKSVRVPIQ